MDKNVTEQRLVDALNRLLEGKPVNTKLDGRISIKRINDEAGLSQGAVYYYKDFVSKAREEIDLFKKNQRINDSLSSRDVDLSKTKKLRREINKEKRLKDDYREQLGNQKVLNDMVVQANVSLAFRILELENEIRRNLDAKVLQLSRKS